MVRLRDAVPLDTSRFGYNAAAAPQTYASVISGTGGFTRFGNGSQTDGTAIFTAANTYSGGTNVTFGTLLVNNTSGSGTGLGSVMVGTKGTLGGTGTISGSVVDSATRAPVPYKTSTTTTSLTATARRIAS